MASGKLVPGLGFVLFLSVVGLVIGLFVGGALVPKNSGLAGGAIVFSYGVGGLLIALVLGIVVAIRLPRSALVRAMWISLAGVLFAALVLFLRYRFVQKAREARQEAPAVEQSSRTPTQPVP